MKIMNKERFKFVSIANKETVYHVQKIVMNTKEYYVLLWEDETGEHDTGIGAYVWEIDEVEAWINEGVWIIVD
jgi:hypothetical protein